ncbi:MAG: hypothetical protein SGPRY_004461, partial [Prymnesium sp.]
ARARELEGKLARTREQLAEMSERHAANLLAARETARQLHFVRHNSDKQLSSLRQRLQHAETDLESLVLDPLLSVSSEMGRVEAVCSRVSSQLEALEARRAELGEAEAQHALARQQQAAAVLAELSAGMQASLSDQKRPRNAAAGLLALEGEVRGWAQRALEASAQAGLTAARFESARSVARQAEERRAPRAGGGLLTRALGEVAVGGRGGRRSELPSAGSLDQSKPTQNSRESVGACGKRAAATGKGLGGGRIAADRSTTADGKQREAQQVWLSLTKPTVDSKLGVTLAGAEGPPLVERVSDAGIAMGILRAGDRILSINQWVANGHADTTSLLKSVKGTIKVKVER